MPNLKMACMWCWVYSCLLDCSCDPNKLILQSWSPSPSEPKHSLTPDPHSSKTFGYNAPLSYSRPPQCPSSPPPCLSLSLSLGFCLGARLQSRYGKEHIQWGLSQPLSVSIKDPGNTALSTFKGPASLLNLSPRLGLPAPPFIFMQPLESLKYISSVNLCRQWGPPSTTQLGCPNTHSCSGQLRGVCSSSVYLDCSRRLLALFGRNFGNIFQEIQQGFHGTKQFLALMILFIDAR